MVPTVKGAVPADQLGRTLLHEHLFVGSHELERVFPGRYGRDRDEAVRAVVGLLDDAAAAGVRTIVDQTPLGLGRDLDLIRRAAEASDVNVVIATGAYVLRDLPDPLQLRGPGRTMFGGPEPLVELFVGDLQDGVEGTDVRAGIIKVATDRFGVTKDVERVLRAAARAHRETGALISTHTNARSRCGLDQQRIFAEEGVDMARTLIGHCGDTDDRAYHRALLDGGSVLGMDRFGLDWFLPHDRRVACVAALCADGHASRLVLSHDATGSSVAYAPGEMARVAPNSHWAHIEREVVPALRAAGVSAADVERMLVDNPRRLLEAR